MEAELACALAAKERAGLLRSPQRATVAAAARNLLAGWAMFPVEAEDFTRVAHLAALGLHAGDALHLAIAARHGAGLVTRDRPLGDAARAIGLEAHLLA